MGLLPLVLSALSIFSGFVIISITVSFIIYKIKSPGRKPYQENQTTPAIKPIYVHKVSAEPVRTQPANFPQVNYPDDKFNRVPKHPFNESARFQVINSVNMMSNSIHSHR
ncbi:MAG: hypothetical protein ACM34K_21390 [Bacillota bacterium]